MIHGFWSGDFPLPLVRAAVWGDGVRPNWVTVTFVLDTGASDTCIHPLDATRRLGMTPASLDPSGWANPTMSDGVGGSATYLTLPASYAFLHSDRTLAPEFLDEETVGIGALTLSSQALPSLLGWNVLRHFDIHVRKGGPITLERL